MTNQIFRTIILINYKMLTKVVLVLNLMSIVSSFNYQFDGQWSGSRHFDQNYLFKWKTDEINKLLTIRVEVKTRGWVGFGFSAHGKMAESDLVIGWVIMYGTIMVSGKILATRFYLLAGLLGGGVREPYLGQSTGLVADIQR